MSPPIRLLYAEDNPQDADLTQAHFARSAPDLVLEILGTGELCQERLARQSYDVLLLDNHLPDVDGIEVLRRLRKAGHRLPVVMLTVVGDEDTVARALLAGADDYVTKAGNYLTRLPSLLRTLLERVSTRPYDESAQARARRVLYVEPHLTDAELTVDHFKTEAPHLQLHVVDRCRDALDLLSGNHTFDMVLSDLRVPEMNALEFLHEAQRRGIDLPFIVLTGDGDEQTAVALLRLGASDYIVKRDKYLTQLPHSIDHALHRFHLDRTTRRLRTDIENLNRSLEQRVAARTAELQWEVRERQRVEADLRTSSERYFRTMENMLEGCYILSPEWRYIYVNEAGARHARRTKEELIGRVMTEVFPGIDESQIFAEMRRCMTERIHVHVENAFANQVGQAAWFELSLEPVPEGMFMLSIETTGRKNAEDALRKSKNDLAVTLQSIGDAVIATDAAGRITNMNATAESVTGWPLAEVGGRPLKDVFRIISAESRQEVEDPVQRVLTHGKTVGLANHTTLISRNGAEYQIADTAAPIRDDQGEVRGVVLVFKDVTDQYRVQQLLHDREEELRLIANALPGPVSRMSRDGRYLFVNATLARWMGRDVKDIIGKNTSEVQEPWRNEHSLPYVKRALGGEAVTYEAEVPRSGATPVHALITLIPDSDPGGGRGGYIGVGTDITARRVAEQKLQKSEAMLKIAGRVARLGGWALDLSPPRLIWTDEISDIHDLPPGQAIDLETSFDFVAPEYRETTRLAFLSCARDGRAFDIEVEVITAKGRRLWVRTTGEAERNRAGEVVRVHGALQDIDHHKKSEQRISSQLGELLRWQQAMVNREGRAQELKAEVNSLLRELNRPPRYGTSEP